MGGNEGNLYNNVMGDKSGANGKYFEAVVVIISIYSYIKNEITYNQRYLIHIQKLNVNITIMVKRKIMVCWVK